MKTLIRMALFVLVPVLCFSSMAEAQENESTVRTEYLLCKLKDGKTMEDVYADAKAYGDHAKEAGSKYNQYLVSPLFTGTRLSEQGITHMLVGYWPDGDAMYKEYGNYLNNYEEPEDSPHTCSVAYATIDVIAVNKINPQEKIDKKGPMQLADCKLNEGKTMEDAMVATAKATEIYDKGGFDGYAVHYQTPYLGFQSADVEGMDFYTMIWWQSFDHRAEMAQNFYKIEAEAQPIMDEVMTCSDPRAYVASEIFRTW